MTKELKSYPHHLSREQIDIHVADRDALITAFEAGPVFSEVAENTRKNLDPKDLDRAVAGAASVILTEYEALGLPSDHIEKLLEPTFRPDRTLEQQLALIATATEFLASRGIPIEGVPVPILHRKFRRKHAKLAHYEKRRRANPVTR